MARASGLCCAPARPVAPSEPLLLRVTNPPLPLRPDAFPGRGRGGAGCVKPRPNTGSRTLTLAYATPEAGHNILRQRRVVAGVCCTLQRQQLESSDQRPPKNSAHSQSVIFHQQQQHASVAGKCLSGKTMKLSLVGLAAATKV